MTASAHFRLKIIHTSPVMRYISKRNTGPINLCKPQNSSFFFLETGIILSKFDCLYVEASFISQLIWSASGLAIPGLYQTILPAADFAKKGWVSIPLGPNLTIYFRCSRQYSTQEPNSRVPLLSGVKCSWGDPPVGHLRTAGSTTYRSQQCRPLLKCDLSTTSAFRSHCIRVTGMCAHRVLHFK